MNKLFTYLKPKSEEELSIAKKQISEELKKYGNYELYVKWVNAKCFTVEFLYYKELRKRKAEELTFIRQEYWYKQYKYELEELESTES